MSGSLSVGRMHLPSIPHSESAAQGRPSRLSPPPVDVDVAGVVVPVVGVVVVGIEVVVVVPPPPPPEPPSPPPHPQNPAATTAAAKSTVPIRSTRMGSSRFFEVARARHSTHEREKT